MAIYINKKINAIDKDTLLFILKNGKSSNIIKGKICKPLIEFSYQIVKIEVPELLTIGNYTGLIKLLFGKKSYDFYSLGVGTN